ncbi:mitochondrial small ribosomal subunit Rsm22-domain-containing protein [Protomyces lactucae-debilis]|uniref:Mitochondrial small ribosomal subunit Rsm22-domain-containing protein n=1 Tax=Protomyces lactucae-debilis TaxID=2754530 RepID=A0A1Y2FGX6_PROLT|nr:mitochondrial small ribosomal subunit Rsm22-domain-containing protein [Protomyces lactucae-debilis]ORY83190.1 mitochondrial small ribosomal subunit Rsm22-domain-containing protein [Protomyces lactucae-debilis]
MDQIFNPSLLSVNATDSIASEDEWQSALDHAAGVREKEEAEPETSGSDDAALFAANRIGQVVMPSSITDRVGKILGEVHGPAIRQTAMRFYLATTTKASQPGSVVSDFGGGSTMKRSFIPMPSGKDFTSLEADAFLAGFMPQIYATSYTVLKELRKRLGEAWYPGRVLDAGVGPGIGALAFHQVYTAENPLVTDESVPRDTRLHVVVANQGMRDRADTIWKGQTDAKVELFWKMPGTRQKQYDLVLAPHTLLDAKGPNSQRDAIVKELWARVAHGGVLLLLERGTPLGFEAVARAREILLRKSNKIAASTAEAADDLRAAGIEADESSLNNTTDEACHVIAPCPHDGVCPLWMFGHQPKRQQWCHFSQRLQRPEYLQRTKHAKTNTEDCTYSYVMLRKGLTRPEQPIVKSRSLNDDLVSPVEEELRHESIVSSSYHWPRIILPPLKKHKHILLDVCSSGLSSEDAMSAESKLERMTIPKSQGTEQYRFARRSHWGDLLPFRGKTVVERPVVDRQGKRKKYSRRQHLVQDVE